MNASSRYQPPDPPIANRSSLIETLERNGPLLCTLLLAAMGLSLAIRANLRPFWFDELSTFYIARLDLLTIWKALAAGAEPSPPLNHIVTRFSQHLLGPTEFGTRFPAIVGFLAAGLFLYKYVANRYGVLCGLITVLLLSLSGAHHYGAEARHYGIVLGCCAIALWSWQQATDVHRRPYHILLFMVSLTAAIASHFYSILLLIPFGIAELVRTYGRRSLDWPVWSVLTLSAASLLLHWPIIRAGAVYRTGHFSPVSWSSLPDFIVMAYGETWLLILVAVAISLRIWWDEQRRQASTAGIDRTGYPPHELAAVFVLLLLPILAILLGVLYTKLFLPRYALPGLLGFAAILPAALHAMMRPTVRWKLALLLVLLAGFLGIRLLPLIRSVSAYQPAELQVAAMLRLPAGAMDSAHKIQPILVTAPLLYPVLYHYSTPELRQRLVYVADSAAALQFTGMNMADLNLINLAPWTDLRLETYGRFIAENGQFYLFHAPADSFQWITRRLQAGGRSLTVIDVQADYQWLHCCS